MRWTPLLLKHRSRKMEMAGRGAPASRAVSSGSAFLPVHTCRAGLLKVREERVRLRAAHQLVSQSLFTDSLTHSLNRYSLSTYYVRTLG